MKIIDDIRHDEKTDEYCLVFKGKDKFDEFCNRIHYMNYMIDSLVKKNNELMKRMKEYGIQ